MRLFRRRTVYLLLAVLILLSIIVRYPLVEHERHQTDSYFVHFLSQSVVDEGRALWIFSPLSYFGYYPFSYPSGVPFLLADLSSVTGLSIEISILLMNMTLAVIFCISVFGLARQFLVRDEYALMAVFFAVLASRFVDTSYWVASARGPLILIIILTTFVAFRSANFQRRAYMPILALFIFAALVIHHMAVLLLLFGLGYILATVEAQYLLPKISLRNKLAVVSVNFLLLAVVAIVAFGSMDYFRELAQSTFGNSGFLKSGSPTFDVIANMVISYTNQIGFILIVAVLGAPIVLRRSRPGITSLFMVTLLIAFIPMIGSSLYVSMLIAPFVAILGTKFIAHLLESRRSLMSLGIVAILMAASVALPIWSCDRWNSEQYSSGDTIEVDNGRFSDASYLRTFYDDEAAISNTYVLTIQLHALTGMEFRASGIFLALNGEVKPEDIERNVTWSSREFPTNLYLWFEYSNEPNVDFYVLGFLMGGISFASGSQYAGVKDYWSSNSKLLVVVDNNWPTSSVSQYSVLPGSLLIQLQTAQWIQVSPKPTVAVESYAIYESEGVTLFAFEIPNS